MKSFPEGLCRLGEHVSGLQRVMPFTRICDRCLYVMRSAARAPRQAPTGARLIMELIEELALAGGGYGLFTGCAAGDTALAVIIKAD